MLHAQPHKQIPQDKPSAQSACRFERIPALTVHFRSAMPAQRLGCVAA